MTSWDELDQDDAVMEDAIRNNKKKVTAAAAAVVNAPVSLFRLAAS